MKRHVTTYHPSVKSGRGGDLIVGVDAPVVLPTSAVCGVVLSAWLSSRYNGLPRLEVDDRVRLDWGA
jgi:hypothetical protein